MHIILEYQVCDKFVTVGIGSEYVDGKLFYELFSEV